MSEFGKKIIESARARVGKPFRHHFKPENICEYGKTTLAQCMEVGMNDEGYDCSGLVIASICEVLAMSPPSWPAQYRHLEQMKSLETSIEPLTGDALIFYQQNPSRTHMGIFVSERVVIHASGISGIVEEGVVLGDIQRTATIRLETLLALPQK